MDGRTDAHIDERCNSAFPHSDGKTESKEDLAESFMMTVS